MEHISSLPLRLVLIIDRASQDKVDGGSGSDGCSVATIALSATGVVSVQLVGSRMNLLRCPARINLSTKNFRSWQWFVSWSWSLW